MCLGIPGQIVDWIPKTESTPEADDVSSDSSARMARVRFGGIEKEVSLIYTPEAQIGDYVIVHVGFALSVLDQEEAQGILHSLDQIEWLPPRTKDDDREVPS